MMFRKMCRAKLHRVTVTESRIDYEGSIQIDAALMDAAGLVENEIVLIANLSNGERFETYVIRGPRKSGVIGLNGAAARLGVPGDKLIIMSLAWVEESKLKSSSLRVVKVDAKNRPLASRSK